MTELTEGPSHYSIEKLLSQGVQPFPDLSPEDFAVLQEDIRTKGLINPVLLTVDGYLFDGHQRLKALLALGRKRISAEHVKVVPKVNRDNMLAHAYATWSRLNVACETCSSSTYFTHQKTMAHTTFRAYASVA
jgi:uncharacterized ParB-like nuclease family protein